MAEERSAHDLGELTAWLDTDDAAGRPMRVRRLRELLDMLPVPSEGLTFLGGELSVTYFDEVRRCYLDGSNIAVVLLCLGYVERELAAGLYGAGWEGAKKARLADVLEKAFERGMLSERDWRIYRDLARLRNAHAHFQMPGSPTSIVARTIQKDAPVTEVLAEDARRAVEAMARMVSRRSGWRVELDPPSE